MALPPSECFVSSFPVLVERLYKKQRNQAYFGMSVSVWCGLPQGCLKQSKLWCNYPTFSSCLRLSVVLLCVPKALFSKVKIGLRDGSLRSLNVNSKACLFEHKWRTPPLDRSSGGADVSQFVIYSYYSQPKSNDSESLKYKGRDIFSLYHITSEAPFLAVLLNWGHLLSLGFQSHGWLSPVFLSPPAISPVLGFSGGYLLINNDKKRRRPPSNFCFPYSWPLILWMRTW